MSCLEDFLWFLEETDVIIRLRFDLTRFLSLRFLVALSWDGWCLAHSLGVCLRDLWRVVLGEISVVSNFDI